MPTIYHHQSLKSYNTFAVNAFARRFVDIESINDLEIILNEEYPLRILGGGSNILLTDDVDALVLHNCLKGIELVNQNKDFVWVKAAGGESWHDLVLWCIERGYAGIENLSLIPGSVGAAPIQNIGAYGVELKDVFYELEAVHLGSGLIETFDREDCRFGYRDSIFKQSLKGQYYICSVTLKLSKVPHFNTSYGAIQELLGDAPPTLRSISDAVIAIRRSKLPDPKAIGNAGSFFKNPIIPKTQYLSLLEQFPALPSYPVESEAEAVKLPAGWLIEQAGWKGKRVGEVGVYAQQALVLVNYGQGFGRDIWKLAKDIQADVLQKYGVEIAPEVNIW